MIWWQHTSLCQLVHLSGDDGFTRTITPGNFLVRTRKGRCRLSPKDPCGYFGKISCGICWQFFAKISCGIFWQNIWRDILAKYLVGYSGKIYFGIFWQKTFRDILAKYRSWYFGEIYCKIFWQNISAGILGKTNINDTFQFLDMLDVEKQGWWFSQSHPPSFVRWLVQGVCLSLVWEKQCRSKEAATGSWCGKFGGVSCTGKGNMSKTQMQAYAS